MAVGVEMVAVVIGFCAGLVVGVFLGVMLYAIIQKSTLGLIPKLQSK